ncbi:hypothetical protein AKJ16_DCAP04316 [Drosera capensis]
MGRKPYVPIPCIMLATSPVITDSQACESSSRQHPYSLGGEDHLPPTLSASTRLPSVGVGTINTLVG